jgi:hypothetical protein
MQSDLDEKNEPMYMKNKRHLRGATVRITPNLQPEARHIGPPVLLGFKSDGQLVRMTGVLSYRNGGVVEYDAILTEDEEKELTSLVSRVAERVHEMLLDNAERRRHSRTRF